MRPIVTLTLNPCIDGACEAEEVFPVHKVRTFNERYDPGGFGVNVARVVRELGGEELETDEAQEDAVRELVRAGKARMVAVSLGAEGALLGTADDVIRLRPPPVRPKSAVGAGDSFVAGLVLGLAQDRPPEDAFALAVAAGTAAVLTHGTELCRREDVERIYYRMRGENAGAAEE